MVFAMPEHLRILIAKLLKQGFRYHKLCKIVSKFYGRHYELIEIYPVSLKKLLQQGISNGVLVYKLNPNLSDLIKQIVNGLKNRV